MSDFKLLTEEKIQKQIDAEIDTFPAFVKSYILAISGSTSASTRLEYMRDIKKFFQYIIEANTEYPVNDIMDITPQILESLDVDFLNSFFFLYLKAYRENGQIHTNTNLSICRKLSSIRGLYSHLFINDIIKKNPVIKINQPKTPGKEIVFMEPEETQKFLFSVETGNLNAGNMEKKYHEKQKLRDTAIISLLLGLGLRISECIGLDIDDINLNNYEIKIVRKGGKEAILYMSDTLAAIMAEYMEYRKMLSPLPSHETALFLSIQRKRIGVRAVEKLVSKYKNQADISKNITPHKLRSTFATAYYETTSDIYLTAEMLGHASVETTKKYANLSNHRKYENRNNSII